MRPLGHYLSFDAVGRQTGYSYSDGTTPAVTQTLNFLDQPTSVTDAAGTRNFTYNSANQLANETIPGIVNGGLTYTYDTAGRRTAMSFGNGTTTFANAAYSYDSTGRIATVGNSADTLTYSYMPGTGMIASSSWQTATVNTAYTYDSYKRLTNIAVNNVNVYGYTLNDKNQRTGATLPDGNTWTYDYDSKGQLTLAQQFTSTSNLLGTHAFSYDQMKWKPWLRGRRVRYTCIQLRPDRQPDQCDGKQHHDHLHQQSGQPVYTDCLAGADLRCRWQYDQL